MINGHANLEIDNYYLAKSEFSNFISDMKKVVKELSNMINIAG